MSKTKEIQIPTDVQRTEHADMRRLVRSAELAVLAANGKAVP